MKASERKVLLDLLERGDIAAALLVLRASAPARVQRADGPLPRRGPPKGRDPRRCDQGSPLPPSPKWTTAQKWYRGQPGPLGWRACGCTLYPDGALQCAEHEAAKDPEPCRGLIAEHGAALMDWERRMGFSTPASRDFMIRAHAGYYGARVKPSNR